MSGIIGNLLSARALSLPESSWPIHTTAGKDLDTALHASGTGDMMSPSVRSGPNPAVPGLAMVRIRH